MGVEASDTIPRRAVTGFARMTAVKTVLAKCMNFIVVVVCCCWCFVFVGVGVCVGVGVVVI